MSQASVFRQIDADQVGPIQERVTVGYDNGLQSPVGFRYRGRHYEITEGTGSFREWLPDPLMLYLVRANQGVYALYLDLTGEADPDRWCGQWVLHFKVEEEKTNVLVDAQLELVASFYGHLYPDLAIGYRASQYALARLSAGWTDRGAPQCSGQPGARETTRCPKPSAASGRASACRA